MKCGDEGFTGYYVIGIEMKPLGSSARELVVH